MEIMIASTVRPSDLEETTTCMLVVTAIEIAMAWHAIVNFVFRIGIVKFHILSTPQR